MSVKEVIMSCLPPKLREGLKVISDDKFEKLTEIRIRAGRPIVVYCRGIEEIYMEKNPPILEDLVHTIELMSNYSLYAIEEEIKQGYITIKGGHRIGVSGKVVLDSGKIKTIKNFNAINIRISHQILGCAEKLYKEIFKEDKLYHILIAAPPLCGKTTILRDFIRILSNSGKKVSLVDERSEIAGCFNGMPQNDVGMRTDIMDSCPKALGMMLMLRSMSPEVIVADEIGRKEDIEAIEEIINSGVKLICTVHAKDLEDMKKRTVLNELLSKNIFEKIVILSKRNGMGTIEKIYDTGCEKICF